MKTYVEWIARNKAKNILRDRWKEVDHQSAGSETHWR